MLNVIPQELKYAQKTITKYTDNVGGSSANSTTAITATTDKFFLLSEYEVCGTTSQCNSTEATKQLQYEFYAAGNSPLKYSQDSTRTQAISWWLRSPATWTGNEYIVYGKDNRVAGQQAPASFGFAPAFCV